ncbi:MAG: hypothetical protein K8S98_04110 [Planctomycetes bacterium]|nr:hypothetical protein [Planctomycetota bacterium]
MIAKKFVSLGGTVAGIVLVGLSSCSGGGSSGGSFALKDISVSNNSSWRINRAIELTFSKPVDLNTVNLNTVQIREVFGGPSAGEFSYKPDPTDSTKVLKNVVVFQPVCPKKADLSDAGFKAGGINYELKVLGSSDTSGLTVQSTSGDSLSASQAVFFSTPTSSTPSQVFYDPIFGGPKPRVRSTANPADDLDPNFTYLEIGGDPNKRVYFQKDASQVITLETDADLPGGLLPLNLESDGTTSVAMVVYFDQPVDPSALNVSSTRLRWDYLSDPVNNIFSPLDCSVTLVANCVASGAIVRVQPRGILPPDALLRGVITAQFSDLVGETRPQDEVNFARARTRISPSPLADEYLESFTTTANFDSTAGFGDPVAVWANGKLSPSIGFTGTGGPSGTFDVRVQSGKTVIWDTVSTTFTGGPNFLPTAIQVSVGGVLDVRNFRIESGGTLIVQGPHPAVILATGKVEILGRLLISGSDTPGVATLNTTNIPEPGAAGQCGGGRGGTGSPLTSASSPKGGNGFGAFNQNDGGGEGGETAWNDVKNAVNARRGAGGGGGTFGSNQAAPCVGCGSFDQSFIGLDGEPGFGNYFGASSLAGACTDPAPPKGAITKQCPPMGGSVGPAPFGDNDPTNDFFGFQLDSVTSKVTIGELKKPWAGAGGGGGGDASYTNGQTFPESPFDPVGDEKGAGGGGGAGSLHILALDDIVFGVAGQIECRGGSGGGGENTNFFDRVGGGSGGGSGGHVILETAQQIDLTALTTTSTVGIIATGGEGGSGKADNGGAHPDPGGIIEQLPAADACPPGYPATGTNACLGQVDGAGGDGSPGIIQLHVNDFTPGIDILLPVGRTLDDICKPRPLCTPSVAGVNPTTRMVPSFGRRSRGRSVWVPVGLGSFGGGPGLDRPETFDFQGTDPLTGLVQTTSNVVTPLAPVIAAANIDPAGVAAPYVTSAFRIVLDGSGLSTVFTGNPALLKRYLVEVTDGIQTERYEVNSASYDSNTSLLALTVDATDAGRDLTFITTQPRTAALIPAFFRISTDGALDSLPDTATVLMQFEATTADSLGNPIEPAVFGPVFDLTTLNGVTNGLARFVRFDVSFDIDALGTGLQADNAKPSVEYIRIPFRY